LLSPADVPPAVVQTAPAPAAPAAPPKPAAPAAGPLPAAAEAGLRTLRYSREDEDWRWLARGARAPDRWDGLKYIPLAGRASLSLGADLRVYYEGFQNEGFGVGRSSNAYLQNRALVHADLRLTPSVRMFVQLQSEGVTVRKGGPRRTIDRNDLDLNQAFVETSFSNGSLRVGRQELRLGVGRIVSTRDGFINVRLPLDGARLILRGKAGRLDAFAFRQVLTTPDAFDDRSAGQPYLWGAQFAKAQANPAALGVELYGLGYDSRRSVYFDGTAEERRRTLGARLFLTREGWDQDFEANYQFGRFGAAKISAWSAIWEGGYTFAKPAWRPRLGWGVIASSGDSRKGDGQLGSYRPFVVRHPWGQLAAFGVTNVEGVQAVGNLQPRRNLRLTARRYWLRRFSADDGLYSGGYQPLRNGSPAQSRTIGTQTELAADYDHDRHLRISLALSRLNAGRYIQQGAGGKDIGYAAAVLLYRF